MAHLLLRCLRVCIRIRLFEPDELPDFRIARLGTKVNHDICRRSRQIVDAGFENNVILSLGIGEPPSRSLGAFVDSSDYRASLLLVLNEVSARNDAVAIDG